VKRLKVRKRSQKLLSRLKIKLRRYFLRESTNQNLQAKFKPNFKTVLLRLRLDLDREAILTEAGQMRSSNTWLAKTS
jgi:hypothetical protein